MSDRSDTVLRGILGGMKRLSKKKVIEFLAKHGLRCDHLGSKSSPTYSGTAVNLDVMRRANKYRSTWPKGYPVPPDLAAGRILHELGHALLVSPARLKMENFGLGQDNIGGPVSRDAGIDPATKRREEVMATVLMIAISAVIADVDWALDFLDRSRFNSDDQVRAEVWDAVGELQRRGLLVGHRPSDRVMRPQLELGASSSA